MVFRPPGLGGAVHDGERTLDVEHGWLYISMDYEDRLSMVVLHSAGVLCMLLANEQ